MKPATFLFAIISGAITILIMAVFASAILKDDKTTVNRIDYAGEYATTNSQVRLTKIGPTTSEEDYRQMVITIGSGQRRIEINKGYLNSPLKSQSFVNNIEAYKAFLIQLANDGFFDQKKLKEGQSIDDAKACSDGVRYKMELLNAGSAVLTNWGSTCGYGSFAGDSESDIEDNFTQQIPGYSDIVSDVRF